MPMRDHLLLYINSRPARVAGEDAFLTLSDYLRRHHRLTGTKVVCAEGDCGSCSVLVGRVKGDRIAYSAVTSCIQLMLQLDATHVITIEGLSAPDQLNPIQESLVHCQGAQCGFCTPGFVVSLYDAMHDARPHDAHSVQRALVGNLCRCTGYDSIIRSALQTDRTQLKTIDDLYPPNQLLPTLQRAAGEEVLVKSRTQRFYKPTTIQQAVRFRSHNPEATIVSGGTDIGVQVNKRTRSLTTAMSTSALNELDTITTDAGGLHVGAAVTLTELERITATHLPELSQYLAWFGSPPIKNAGTLAGNLANASPIGDMLPPLYVLAAEVEVAGPAGSRRIPIEIFYTGYRRTALAPGEMITAAHIPLPQLDEIFKLYKVSRRKDLDISTFNAAIWLRLSGRTIDDIRIAFGGVGPMVLRMKKSESALRGSPATLDHFEQAGEIARDEVTPITDVRGSETYRRTLAANVLKKFWHETFADGRNGDHGDNDHPTPAPRSQLFQPIIGVST
jgi:xanthine dehydrogenase small subunit